MGARLDGNALAGPLSEVFDFDVVLARGRCASCGDVAAIAEALVVASDGRLTAHCRRCDAELLVVLESHGEVVVTMSGVRDIHAA